jgi:uncharacterized protein (DUF1800 family)
MRGMWWRRSVFAAFLALAAGGAVANPAADARDRSPVLPWAAAGLTEREAAAHLLDRFAHGPRPGDVDRLVEQGLERWLEAQLGGDVDDSRFVEKARSLDAWTLPAGDILRVFPPPPVLRREAMRAGLIDQTMAPPEPGQPAGKGRLADQRSAILELYRERGWRSQRELFGQLVAHKLLQAAHSERQLESVLIDFWFNHFNVSLTDNQARSHLLSFERDAIAPGVLGHFDDLLAKVAAHPAMLLYLDNAQSTANPGAATTLDRRLSGVDAMRGRGRAGMGPPRPGAATGAASRRPGATELRAQNRARGLNENYARELLELHTLGVDGGYTQDDVIAVARAFTGWTVVPPGGLGEQAMERMRRAGGGRRLGYVERDGFVFRADTHDAEPKTVLGRKLPGGRGIEDGLDVLELVAHHPSTARHLATKIAARFVADDPPPSLVDRLAQTFLATDGDLRQVMRALAYSPEFWSAEARGRKIKSPFELAVSAVRATGGEVAAAQPLPLPIGVEPRRSATAGPLGLADWIARMGQPLYAYQAPTGYPDRAEAWVSTGSLLSRMNFGINLAAGKVAGVELDLAALSSNREPESLEHALAAYGALLLPERDLTLALRRLEPMVGDPDLGGRVERAAAEAPAASPAVDASMRGSAGSALPDVGDGDAAADAEVDELMAADPSRTAAAVVETGARGAIDPIQQVVGVLLGSPEFQRR